MHILSDNDYKLYTSIIQLTQESLRKTLLKYLQKKYPRQVIATKDYIIATGDIPIALCAHMDTVWKSPPKDVYYDRLRGVIWSPEGGCGDDRAGVFAILKILQSGLRPTIIFTTDEEKGGLGAEKLVRDLQTAPTELKYIIQLDRRGDCDCVFYDCDNDDFVQYIESWGFIENYGSFSDISEICPAWGIAGVNLSVGYFDEHTVSETVHVSSLMSTISKVKRMLAATDIPEFEYIPSLSSLRWYKWWEKEYGFDYGYPSDDDPLDAVPACTCSKCGTTLHTYEAIPVIRSDGSGYFYRCPDCCVQDIEWCRDCGEAFESTDPTEYLCPACKDWEKGGTGKWTTQQSKTNSTK